MSDMKRITLTIEIETDHEDGFVSWTLDDWRGRISEGVSVDTAANLVHLWAADIEHVLNEAWAPPESEDSPGFRSLLG